MALFLVQHGQSVSKETDPERGLSEDGKEETIRIADVAKHYKINVSKILHSRKKRAGQTADIFQEKLMSEGGTADISGINPMDDVKTFSSEIRKEANNMIVGHLPFLEKLVSLLTTGNEDICVYKFQNSGIVCLDQDENGWFIKWTLNPNIS